MAIRIITDSASDILPHLAKEWNITVLALPIRFGDEEFFDGENISRDEFYDKLIESDTLPKTSQITPYRYDQAFAEADAAGDEVVCLTMSSKVSGTYQSALLAAAGYEGRVHVVDTLQLSSALYLLVKLAVMLRDKGKSAEEITRIIEHEKMRVHVVAVFNTLEYLRKGGRISGAAAIAGGLLSLKPVLTVDGGEVKVLGKARGSKKGNNLLIEFVKNQGGMDFRLPMAASYAGHDDSMVMKYLTDCRMAYEGMEDREVPVIRIGATIGTYSGPGAIAFAFFENQK